MCSNCACKPPVLIPIYSCCRSAKVVTLHVMLRLQVSGFEAASFTIIYESTEAEHLLPASKRTNKKAHKPSPLLALLAACNCNDHQASHSAAGCASMHSTALQSGSAAKCVLLDCCMMQCLRSFPFECCADALSWGPTCALAHTPTALPVPAALPVKLLRVMTACTQQGAA